MTDPTISDLSRRVARIEAALAQPILPAIDPPQPPDPPEPPDPPVPPEPGDWRALDYIDNDAATNKLLALPALRRSRGPREDVETLGDIRANDWETGQSLTWSAKSSVVPKGYAQWSSNLHKGQLVRRGGSYTWDNIGVAPGLDATQLKWGTREYNAPDRVFVDCDFTEIPQEHGLYVSNSGDTTIESCTFLRVGSQGAQWAHRPEPYQQYDPDNMPYDHDPQHRVANSHFIDCADGGTRPSFNLTYFCPGSSAHPGDIVIANCSFVCDWNSERGGARSTGALVVANQQGGPPIQAPDQMMSTVTVQNTLFDFTKGDRSIASLQSVDLVTFEDCAFIARDHAQPNVTIDKEWSDELGGTKTQLIRIKNCRARGDAKLVVFLPKGPDGKQERVTHSLDTPGQDIWIDGRTGRATTAPA